MKPKEGDKPDINKLRETAKKVIEDYKGLNEADKTSLKEQFPTITSVIQNEKFQNVAKSLLKTEN